MHAMRFDAQKAQSRFTAELGSLAKQVNAKCSGTGTVLVRIAPLKGVTRSLVKVFRQTKDFGVFAQVSADCCMMRSAPYFLRTNAITGCGCQNR